MDKCHPGTWDQQLQNMIGWYEPPQAGGAPDFSGVTQAITLAWNNLPSSLPVEQDLNAVPVSRFGAS